MDRSTFGPAGPAVRLEESSTLFFLNDRSFCNRPRLLFKKSVAARPASSKTSRIASNPSTVVMVQHMALMTWLFTLPAFLMMLLFAIAQANEGFRRPAPGWRLYALIAGAGTFRKRTSHT